MLKSLAGLGAPLLQAALPAAQAAAQKTNEQAGGSFWPTLIALLPVLALILLALRKILKDRKNGVHCSSCAGGCAHCAGACHSPKTDQK